LAKERKFHYTGTNRLLECCFGWNIYYGSEKRSRKSVQIEGIYYFHLTLREHLLWLRKWFVF